MKIWKLSSLLSCVAFLSIFVDATCHAAESCPGVVKSEFIYETAPFPSCHASTIVESINGVLVAAWFGGTAEGKPDVGIWVSRNIDGKWTESVEVANGVQPNGMRHPSWNPVLFQPKSGPLMLFYKVGPTPSSWWGMLRTSEDNGWRVHFERSKDGGKTWQAGEAINDGKEIGAIQPSVLFHSGGRLQAVGRTRQGKVFEVWSNDGGVTWGNMTLTGLPNPNSG